MNAKPFLSTMGGITKKLVWVGNHLYEYGEDGFRKPIGFIFPSHLRYIAAVGGRNVVHSSRFDAKCTVEMAAFGTVRQ